MNLIKPSPIDGHVHRSVNHATAVVDRQPTAKRVVYQLLRAGGKIRPNLIAFCEKRRCIPFLVGARRLSCLRSPVPDEAGGAKALVSVDLYSAYGNVGNLPIEEKVMKRIRKLYEYKDEKYSIIVPADLFDIVKDSTFLGHCVANTNRYYERISSEESYIVFLRYTDKPSRPWYTLEIEPGGTIRQKRSYSNEQYSDLQEAVPFLKEWQGEGIRALLNSSLSPMKIENEGFTALVLPVRMKNRA